MEIKSIGFIGGGRVVRILVAGWQRARTALPVICVCEPDVSVRDVLTQECSGIPVHDALAVVAAQDLVVLAVHPPAVGKVLAEVGAHLRPEALVLSLAPKVTLAAMQGALGGFGRVARMIPNAPSLVGRGFNPVCFGADVDDATRASLLALVRPLGETPEVPEDALEAYAILAAMGPTYLWPQLYELTELGVAFGLDRPAALATVAAMIEGAARTMAESGLDEAAVLDLVPVHPLREQAAAWRQQYREVLVALHAKLRP